MFSRLFHYLHGEPLLPKKHQLSGTLKVLVLAVMVFGTGLLANFYYQDYVVVMPEATVFHGVDLSGESRQQARQALRDVFEEWEQDELRITVTQGENVVGEQTLVIADLGFEYDEFATVDALMPVAQEWKRVFREISAEAHAAAVDPVVEVDEEEALVQIMEHISTYVRPMKNAALVYDDESGTWEVSESQVGYELAQGVEELVHQQMNLLAVRRLDENLLTVALVNRDPEHTTEQARSSLEVAKRLQAKTLSWRSDGEERSFSLQEHPWMIQPQLADGSAVVKRDELKKYIDAWAQAYDKEPGDVQLEFSQETERGYRKAAYKGDFTTGRQVNREQMVDAMIAALQGEEQEVKLVLPVDYSPAKVIAADGTELTLISTGRSSYRLGNGPDRVHNVQHGLSKYDGVVIPQGETFSFNQVLGWVTYEAGWKPAMAIFGGGGIRKVPGGGLCQVSTTMYRAAVNLGAPVKQRKPHSLDVAYYHEYGYGIDSAIYPPSGLDMKFVNDTPGPIFIHTYTTDQEEAFVEFFGIDDGRTVALEQTTNKVLKRWEEKVYTPDMPLGQTEVVKQGWAGRYIEWDQLITRADGKTEKRVIKTTYPVVAKETLVGTGGSVAKQSNKERRNKRLERLEKRRNSS